MKLARLGPVGAERPVLLHEDRYYDLTGLTTDLDGAFWADGPLLVREARVAGALRALARSWPGWVRRRCASVHRSRGRARSSASG